MPSSSGPNTVSDSIVFNYDIGDVANSYKGEPTTNYLTTALTPNSATKESFSGTVTDNAELAPDGTLTAARFTVNSGYVYEVLSIPAGTTINYSVWIKMLDGNTTTSVGPYIWSYGGPVTGIVSRDLSGLSTSWKRFSMSYTTLSGQSGFALSYAATNGGVYGTYALWRPQLEYKNYATPFVNGTRSSTQGLLDISGRGNTINLTNMTYGANDAISFDGTDDYMNVGSSSNFALGTSNFTIEVMIYPQSFSNYIHMVALPLQSTFALKAEVNTGNIYYYDPSFTTYGSTSGWTLTLNQWNHVVLVRYGNIAYAYLNGVSRGSKSGFNTNMGTQEMNIGWGWGGEFTAKKINVVKMYNRALSATEVANNYNQYKKRFNLP